MKMKLATWLRQSWASVLLAGSVVLSGGCAIHGGVAYGEVPYYDYYYYPEWNVYFYPHGHLYYWHEGEHWRSGARLPERYSLREEHREHLRLHTREPWTEHHWAHR